MALSIGGFQKNSLIDFPGIVASIVFVQGCNFRCPYCHNPELIPFLSAWRQKTESPGRHSADNFNLGTGKTHDNSEVISFLEKRRGLIEGVVISGGEPTLQPELESFCFLMKNMGYQVKLDTNGSRPDVLERLFYRNLVDYVAMDIKGNEAGYRELSGIRDGASRFDFSIITTSIELIMGKAPAYEFRTTCVRPFIDMDVMEQIASMIKGSPNYALQQCSHRSSMLNPEFFLNKDLFFTDDELEQLKSYMASYVERCSIR